MSASKRVPAHGRNTNRTGATISLGQPHANGQELPGRPVRPRLRRASLGMTELRQVANVVLVVSIAVTDNLQVIVTIDQPCLQ